MSLRNAAHYALLVAAATTTASYAALAAGHSYFFTDDMAALYRLGQLTWLEFALDSVNIQVVPLHRLAMRLIRAALGPGFAPAVGVLLALHALGVWLVYRLTQQLCAPRSSEPPPRRLLPALLTCLYAGYPFVGVQFLWFSSGLHRFPYAAATLFALHRWLHFRQSGSRLDVVLIAGAMLVACGFYGKGPLVAVQVAALELCLWRQTEPSDKARHAKVLGFLVMGGLALVGANAMTATMRPLGYAGGAATAEFVWVALKVFVRSLFGQAVATQPQGSADTALFSALQLLIVLASASIGARRSNWRVWAVLAACVLGNIAVAAVSRRGVSQGWIFNAHAHRYGFDQMPMFMALLALALRDLHARGAWRTPAIVATCLCALAYAAHGVHSVHALLPTHYKPFTQKRVFYNTFQASLTRLRATHAHDEIVFQREAMPARQRGFTPEYHSLEHMTLAMGEDLVYSDDGRFTIEDDGSIQVKGPDFKPQRRRKQPKPPRARPNRAPADKRRP